MSDPTVAAVGPDGTPIRVPEADLRAVVDAGGHAMTPAEEKRTQRRLDLEQKYDGTIEGTVAPALAGAARGLTLGGSDQALSQLGEGARQRLLDYQEYAPTASAVGEFGAIAGAALLGDEAGLGAVPEAVGRIGAGAGEAVTAGLGGGRLAGVAGKAVGGAIEGGIYAEGKAASDAALHNEDLTAEQFIAAGAHGAAFGGALGLGAGALSAGTSRLAGGIGRAEQAEEATVGGLRPPKGYQAEAGSFREGLGETLQKTADVKTIKALGGSAGDLRALERNVPGGYRKVAQDVQSDIEATTGKSIGYHNRESLHEYASQRVDELGTQIGKQLKALDEAGAGQAPEGQRFIDAVHKEVIAPNMVETPAGPVVAPGAGAVVKAVDKYLGQIKEATEGRAPTFTEWHHWRVNLDKEIYKSAAKASPATEALRKVRGIMDGELETAGESAAKQMGTSFQDEYQATKSLYQSVKKAQELTERGVAAELARNSFGLGATMGSLTGLATGGPVASVAMGLAGKLVKDRGDMLAADLLGRAADLMGVTRIAARTSARVGEGVAGLVGSKAPVATLAVPKASGGFFSELLKDAGTGAKRASIAGASEQRSKFSRRAEEVATLQANPVVLTDRVGKALGPTATAAPRMTQAATGVAIRGLQFLTSKMPPSRQDPFTLQPQFQPVSRASDSEIAQHARYLEALDHPTMILDLAKSGGLTPDHVEAVKAVYPKLYDQMREEIFRGLVTSKSELPYGRRIQLGILLDLPTDQTLAPDFVSAIQATYTASEKAGEEPPPPQLSQLDVAGSLQTSTQSAAGGLDR